VGGRCLRRLGRRYPKDKYPRVVILIDNAPWHGGAPSQEALAGNPHLELKRLPSYSPQLNVIGRFWKLLRRRATHNRLFDTLADLKRSIRASLCYFQTASQRLRTLIAYAATWEAFGLRLVGLDAKTSLFRPWQVVRYGLDFSGRALFVTVLGADWLLRATLSAWRHQRAFAASAAAAEFDRLMERLEAGTEKRNLSG
jgi:transposase